MSLTHHDVDNDEKDSVDTKQKEKCENFLEQSFLKILAASTNDLATSFSNMLLFLRALRYECPKNQLVYNVDHLYLRSFAFANNYGVRIFLHCAN